MENLIRTITMTGQLPKECFEQEEFAGNAELTLGDCRKIVGLAQISLPERKLRLTPSNPLPESLDAGRVNGLGFDETELTLKMSLPAFDVFFRIQKARLDLNYATSIFMDWPLEYRFASCIFGPIAPPDAFGKAHFRFTGMENLIGGDRFEFTQPENSDDKVIVQRPKRRERERRSARLGMRVNLISGGNFRCHFGTPALNLSLYRHATARFDKAQPQNVIRDRIHTFVTFASILRGFRSVVTDVKLVDENQNVFQLAGGYIPPLDDDEKDAKADEFAANKGILFEAINCFGRFAEHETGHDALNSLATFSLRAQDWSWGTVALYTVAEVLYKIFEGRQPNERVNMRKALIHIAKSVSPFFMEVPSDEWLRKVVQSRQMHIHKAQSMFRQARGEEVLQRITVLHTLLRAYVMLKCEIPAHTIYKALRGTGRRISFYGLRAKDPTDQ